MSRLPKHEFCAGTPADLLASLELPDLPGEGHEHFIVDQGELICVRDSCEGCELAPRCESEEVEVYSEPIPPARRAIGMETEPFLVVDPETVELTPLQRTALDPANLHCVLDLPPAEGLWAGKGQARWYGGRESLEERWPGAAVLDEYEPAHRLVSMDYAAIEPRIATIVTRETSWLAAFGGREHPVYREVSLETDPPRTVEVREGRTYCYIDGDPRETSFDDQCSGCPAREGCTTLSERSARLPGDWHGANARQIFGAAYDDPATPYEEVKDMRGTAKVIGLLLLYGGGVRAVARELGCSESVARQHMDRFFAGLPLVRHWMHGSKARVASEGSVANLLGRKRDMRQWLHFGHSHSGKDRAFAERTSLNYPCQSTAGEIQKLAMIRVEEFLAERGMHPLAGMSPPQRAELRPRLYETVRTAQLASIHDEIVVVCRDDAMREILPEILEIMRLRDLMRQLKVDFDLELDVEYDDTRSWTATKVVPVGRMTLWEDLLGAAPAGEAAETSGGALVIDYEAVRERLDLVPAFQQLAHPDFASSGIVLQVYLEREGDEWLKFDHLRSAEDLDSLGIPYRRLSK